MRPGVAGAEFRTMEKIKRFLRRAKELAGKAWRILSDLDTLRSFIIDSGLGPTIVSGLTALLGFVVTFVETTLGIAIAVAATVYAASSVVIFIRRIDQPVAEDSSGGEALQRSQAGGWYHHSDAQDIDYELWGLVNEFTISQTAALWAGLKPRGYYSGQTDATRSLIMENIMNGQLKCYRRNKSQALEPINDKPRATDIVVRDDLIALARRVGDHPRFLFDRQRELFEGNNGTG